MPSKHGQRTYYVRGTQNTWQWGFFKTKTCEGNALCARGRTQHANHKYREWICSPHAAPTQGKFCMHLTCYVVSACSQCRSEAILTTNVFLNLVHVFANRQHPLASTAGCDRGSMVTCFSCSCRVLPKCSEQGHKRTKRFTKNWGSMRLIFKEAYIRFDITVDG